MPGRRESQKFLPDNIDPIIMKGAISGCTYYRASSSLEINVCCLLKLREATLN